MREKIIFALFWKLLERGGTQGIQLLVMIVLTRLLLPEDYGLIAIVAIFISVATLLVDSGFYDALVQKEQVDEVDLCSVFYVNVATAVGLYGVLFVSAPWIAVFFAAPELIAVLRVLGLSLFFSACQAVQQAMIARAMHFKKLFVSSLSAVFVSGAVGLSLAVAGYGIWALVGQQLTSQFVLTLVLFCTVKWRPRLLFSFGRLKPLFLYGWKLVVSTLIYNVYTHGQSFVIGKVFSPAILGFYSRGQQLPNILVSNINGSIQAVLFPALASQQRYPGMMKHMVRRAIVVSSFVLFPMMVGLAVIAQPLVVLLFTEKWLTAVPFLQIFCAYYALWTIDAANLHAIKALGRSDLFLKLEMVKFLCGVLILIVTIPFGVYAVAVGVLVNRVLTMMIDAMPNRYLLGYSLFAQVRDVWPSLSLAAVMGCCIYPLHWLMLSPVLTIVLQIIGGVVIYIGLASWLKVECLSYVREHIEGLLGRRKLVGKLN